MTPRQRFMAALERQPLSGRVPHFELLFFLTMEAFGRLHPAHRSYHQWDQMAEQERSLHRQDMAELYVKIAERYEHSAIFIHHCNPERLDEILKLIYAIRELSGDRYFLMLNGDATCGVPDGEHMEEFCFRLADEPDKVKAECSQRVKNALQQADVLCRQGGLDGFALCTDYCLNTGPFLSPGQFSEFVTPYLAELIQGYRERGFYTVKHTDGNIMPILDQLVQAKPHALHSLDPQGGVDIAEIKRLIGKEVCLIGNVNCAKLDTGTDEECDASVRYALKHGMPGFGYIFSTSNCIYTGMRLPRYERMLDIWRREGNYS